MLYLKVPVFRHALLNTLHMLYLFSLPYAYKTICKYMLFLSLYCTYMLPMFLLSFPFTFRCFYIFTLATVSCCLPPPPPLRFAWPSSITIPIWYNTSLNASFALLIRPFCWSLKRIRFVHEYCTYTIRTYCRWRFCSIPICKEKRHCIGAYLFIQINFLTLKRSSLRLWRG